MTLTLQQIKDAGLPASIKAQTAPGRPVFDIDYLPGNPPKERFRVSGGLYRNTTWGPGGPKTPQDGWHHEDGCSCQFCAATPRPVTSK